ncbi:uncharacterized protein LOC133723251 [Rosa rugosa]|uniref:uncharacterized protein LOC133723251 n=1 Tax=Rosa rugosa TaxID=74645 RepID=UPI002B413021|nr:uncharacterized protein LOC133723251 [Rosa rugosa]
MCEDSNTMLEENDYLGCYRAEAPKSYMTKGWESYIHSEGQKFQVWYGTELAKTALHGDEADSYAQLFWFSECVMKSNPDSRIVIEFHRETHRFQRMFVTYGAWMKGFQSCRPILFIDATFITNKYKGQIIAASAKDANQDSENESNWRFFLEVLAEELAKHPMRRVTFISDRHVGHVSAFPRVFPNNPHGFCFRHQMSNLSDKFPAGSYLKDRIPYLFMCCAYSRTPEMYEFNMEILRSEGDDIVAQFLEDLPKENWCMAYFNGERFGEMTNNLAESFNNWVLPLKSLPILDINDGIRVKSMASIAARKEDAQEWSSELCPAIQKKLKENLEVGRHWRVSRSDTYVYEVHCQKYNSMVFNSYMYSDITIFFRFTLTCPLTLVFSYLGSDLVNDL